MFAGVPAWAELATCPVFVQVWFLLPLGVTTDLQMSQLMRMTKHSKLISDVVSFIKNIVRWKGGLAYIKVYDNICLFIS